MDQIRSSWIKLVQVGSNMIKKDQDKSDWLFGSNQIKLVQIWSNPPVGSNWFKLILIGSNWFKLDQKDQNKLDWLLIKSDKTGSNWIKSDI